MTTYVDSDAILNAVWTKGSDIDARLRLATIEEKQIHDQQQAGVWWYAGKAWHFVKVGYNAVRMMRNMNFVDNMAPWVGTDGKYRFVHVLPGRVAHCFYHPTAMEAIFKHARSNEATPLAPFVEKGDMSKQLLVNLFNEIFPNTKVEAKDFILANEASDNNKLRKALHAYFSKPKIKQLRGGIKAMACETVERWRSVQETNGELNISHAVRVFTSDIIRELFIGSGEYNHDIFRAVDTVILRILECLLKKGPKDPAAWEEAKVVLREAVNASINGDSVEQTFAKELMSQGLSEDEARAMVFTLYLGGYETTANSMINTLLMLARDQEKQAKIVEEVKNLGDESLLNYNLEKDLPTLHSAITESLKEFCPAYGIGRTPRDDLVMEIREKDGNVIPYYIAKGEKIAITPTFAAQVYGNEDPSRYHNDSQFWYPFGHGHHVCPGKDLALAEMVLFITELLSKYELTTTFEGKPTQVGFFVNTIKEKITIQMTPRKE